MTLEDKVPGGETWITGGYNFQATEATLETSFALQMPKAWHLQWEIANDLNPQVPLISHTENDTVIYIWKYGEMPPLMLEGGMPHVNDIVPRLRYSSIKDWDSVYTWYKDLAKGRYTPDTNIEAKVQQLTSDLTTEAAKNTRDLSLLSPQISDTSALNLDRVLINLRMPPRFFKCNTGIAKIKPHS